jgi:ATP/ADP translocase
MSDSSDLQADQKQNSDSKIRAKATDYIHNLEKYIPTEIVAAYIVLFSLFRTTNPPNIPLLWFIFLILLLFAPLYQWKIHNRSRKDIFLSTVCFFMFVFALGGPFAFPPFSVPPVYGVIAAIIAALGIPLID